MIKPTVDFMDIQIWILHNVQQLIVRQPDIAGFSLEVLLIARSKRQNYVTLSTTEAEYIVVAMAFQEATWFRYILKNLDYTDKSAQSPLLLADNQGCLKVAENLELHQKNKHIAVKYHYICEQFAKGNLWLQYVRSANEIAYDLTKPLPAAKHKIFIQKLRLQTLNLKETTRRSWR